MELVANKMNLIKSYNLNGDMFCSLELLNFFLHFFQ